MTGLDRLMLEYLGPLVFLSVTGTLPPAEALLVYV